MTYLHIDPSEIRIVDHKAIRRRLWGAPPPAVRPPVRPQAAQAPTPAQHEAALYERLARTACPDGRQPARAILMHIASTHGVTLVEICGPKRAARISRARMHAAYALATERPDLSFSAIARLLCKDHTSVLHACRRHAELNGLPHVVRP